jgi:hypothetical protein
LQALSSNPSPIKKEKEKERHKDREETKYSPLRGDRFIYLENYNKYIT